MKATYNIKEITNGQFISPQNSQIKPIINYPTGNCLHWILHFQDHISQTAVKKRNRKKKTKSTDLKKGT